MKSIEEEYDIKSIPYLLTLIIIALPYYQAVLESIGKTGVATTAKEVVEIIEIEVEATNSFIMLGFSIFLLVLITSTIVELKKKVRSAVYFRSLLESSKEIKKDANKNKQDQTKLIKQRQVQIEQKQIEIEKKLLWIKIENE